MRRRAHLIAQRSASVIATTGADELLVDLVDRMERLDKRAMRRGRPAPLRSYLLPPEHASPPQGWAVLPLLQLRAAAVVGRAPLDACGLIGPQERSALESALRAAPLTARLYGLACIPPASALAIDDAAPADPTQSPGGWIATPDGHQSAEHATYRFGGDATRGVSAVATVSFPQVGSVRGDAVFIVDIALSLRSAVRLGEAAGLWREGLVLTSAALPEALADILPPAADAVRGELHALAAGTDGHERNRPNELGKRLDLSSLGSPSRPVGASIGVAIRLIGPLAEVEAADAVVRSIDYMALANGYLDPRAGIAALRHEFGLATRAAEQSP